MPASTSRPRRIPSSLLGVIGLIAAAAALAVWLRPPRQDAPHSEDESLESVLAIENPGYVGIAVCAECHGPRADLVKSTRHYKACLPACEGVKSPGFAPGRGVLQTRSPGLRFEMSASGCDFLITRIEKTEGGKKEGSEKRDPFPVGLVYGSGSQFDEMYFSWKGDELFHLPVGWMNPQGRWGSHDPDADQVLPTDPACLECHNTWIAHKPGTANEYRRDTMILGVTCERCHGPGREHTDYHRAHPEDQTPHAILYPGSLSRDRLMDVCAQCHTFNKTIGRPFSYRPGEPLQSFAQIRKPAYPENDSTNQVRYLGESKCFQKSEMTCITCHDPHRLKSSKNSCSQCHKAASCPEQPRLPAAIRSDCVGCHMPTRIRMHFHFYSTPEDRLLPLATRSEHRIGIYPEAKNAVMLAWLRTQSDPKSLAEAASLASQLARFWVEESERLLKAKRLVAAAGALREALHVQPNPATRQRLDEVVRRRSHIDDLERKVNRLGIERLDEAVPLLEEMVRLRPLSASRHYALGSVYASKGRVREAIPHLKDVARYDAYDASGAIKLAAMAFLAGKNEEALSYCEQANKIDPTNHASEPLWGAVLLKLERWAEAEKPYRAVLQVNPADPVCNRGLSESLRHQGKLDEAIRFARRAVRWNESPDVEAILTLADAYTAARRTKEARETLEGALKIANETTPALKPAILERLASLQK